MQEFDGAEPARESAVRMQTTPAQLPVTEPPGKSRPGPVLPRAGINVELKGPNTARPVAALIAEYVDQHGWSAERFLVSSFQHDQLRLLKQLRTAARIGVLLRGLPANGLRIAQQMGAWSVHVGLRSVNGAFVDEAHTYGLKVYVFTVNRVEDLARMRGIGVDGVFTDFPEFLVPLEQTGE